MGAAWVRLTVDVEYKLAKRINSGNKLFFFMSVFIFQPMFLCEEIMVSLMAKDFLKYGNKVSN